MPKAVSGWDPGATSTEAVGSGNEDGIAPVVNGMATVFGVVTPPVEIS
jgi:hypothetical protein